MARTFTTAIVLPGDPSSASQASTKNYVDNQIATKVSSVTAANTTVTVGGTATAPTVAVNAIAESQVTNLTTDLAAKAPLASPTFTGTVTAPRVVKPPNTITYAATVTLDASTGDAFKITATGAITLNAPTSPSDGQMLLVAVLASGAARTITLASTIQLTTGMTTTISPASGKVAFIGIRYSVLSGNWTCLAMTAEL